MRIVRRKGDLNLNASADVGLVPTMGAFHEGHLSLIRQARAENEVVAVSLFVNPLQFGEGEDLARYPRNEERDFALAGGAGADLVFAPDDEEMYGGSHTRVVVSGVGDLWEGARRPGHFDGVATVVCKLFNIFRPKRSYFGRKDLQQCAVISQIVRDLNMQVELRFHDTVREPDGLAMSSRNAYLSPAARAKAPMLHQALNEAAEAIRKGCDPAVAEGNAAELLTREGFRVDYIASIDPHTFRVARCSDSVIYLIAAAALGETHLIDNVPVKGIAFQSD